MGKLALLLAVAGAISAASGATAQDSSSAQKGTNAADTKPSEVPEAASSVQRAQLAADLAAYGRETRNPRALVLAGQIQAQVAATDEERAKTTQGTAAASSAPKPGDARRISAAALFEEARGLAAGDQALLAEIDSAAGRLRAGLSSAVRGLAGGPTRHWDRVLPGTTDIYTLTFRGGVPAEIAVIGDGDTDLDLRVYDENGNLVCSDTDWTDRAICGWTPAWTGQFRVTIQNLGRVYNEYALITN